MKHPKIKLNIENICTRRKDLIVFILEFIPSITFRYVKGKFGTEFNLYISWLIWSFSITLSDDSQ